MDKLTRIVGSITRYADYVARLGMVALLVLVVANVVMRYAFKSIQGAYDYVGLITVVTVSLAISYCAYERGHIEIEILMDRLPKRIQNITASIMMLIGAGFFGMASWQAVAAGNSMREANETTMAVYVPLFPFMYIMAVGMAVMALVVLLHSVKYVSKAVKT